jgi:radical SAM superfamily enzyme YgiQ (UPF0313 family)
MIKISLLTAKYPEEKLDQAPLGIGYLASYLEKNLQDTVLVDLAETKEDITNFKPDILGISSTTQAMNEAILLAKDIKKTLNIPILLGGYHVTALPDQLPDCFDVGIIGEGEITLLELIQDFIKNNYQLVKENLNTIAGLCYKEKNQLIKTNPRSLIDNLDTLPYPRRVLPERRYDVYVFTSRGCPYRCIYCSSTRHWDKFRQFSAEYVVDEMTYLIEEEEANSIYILDDLFIANKKRFSKIVDLILDRKLNEKVFFHGFGRANLLDEETVINLKKINFNAIRIGVETYSERLLKYLKSDSMSTRDTLNAVNLCRKHGLRLRGSFVFGTPGETEEDLEKTYNFIKENKDIFYIGGFYLLVPLPGTPLWDYAKLEGFVSDNMDWSKLDLSFQRKNFDWENFLYLNKDMPRKKFTGIIKRFIEDFEIPIV